MSGITREFAAAVWAVSERVGRDVVEARGTCQNPAIGLLHVVLRRIALTSVTGGMVEMWQVLRFPMLGCKIVDRIHLEGNAMRCLLLLLSLGGLVSPAVAQDVRQNLAYVDNGHARQVLDIYAPANAERLPVVFWIHGGGWQAGDKSEVQRKPQVFTDKGYVFVSVNYRLLPEFAMGDIVGDVARAVGWVHRRIAEHGGDPNRIFIMGHSAGAQLAALLCTDDRWLKAEQVSLASVRGCVPVDGDTFDLPAIIETAETRRRVHGLPQATFGHREKFGNSAEKHRDFSAVTHVAGDKGIPPFLILHVAEHPDTTAQAQRLGNVLQQAGIPVRVFGARETTHGRINADLGQPDDPVTIALFEFLKGK